jgi:DtxR family Mn-dependent transcriptional regulator
MRLVRYDPYEVVTLTPRGEKLGRKIRRRHDTLTEFLTEVLGVSSDRAEKNACRMEHVVDEQVLRKLRMLGDFLTRRGNGAGDWTKEFSAYCARHGA